MMQRLPSLPRFLIFSTVFALVFLAGIASAVAVKDHAEGADRALVPRGMRFESSDTQEGAIRSMTPKQLRRFLKDRMTTCDGCVEKAHLVERALAVRGWATADDYIVAELDPTVNSAATHLGLHHVAAQMPMDKPLGATMLFEQFVEPPTRDYVVGDKICNPALVNGTVYCHSISGMRRNADEMMAATA
jgi:hypothetical protein